ncbi:hypothetical protein GHT06_004500 [Daphnia sinensis]|uniref:RapA2 cadherin-like domain-containing protein n=1 Tax=Daphnia sinensis TaxID=1820382 RepID=A0AAD5PNT2_9CRUS|nr:hypothetical protein GHT06_004500 [Daphnia sinensis]
MGAGEDKLTLESNIVTIRSLVGVLSDRYLFVSIPESDTWFSGNNTKGWLYVVNTANEVKASYVGEISRLYKDGSAITVDRGTLSTSIMVDISANFVIGTAYNTSSDPVYAALNQFLVPEPVVAAADSKDAGEAGGLRVNQTVGYDGIGNVLSNDSGGLTTYTINKTALPWMMETNTSNLLITNFTSNLSNLSGAAAAELQGLYGKLTLNADGSFTYKVDNLNVKVEALRTSTETLTDIFNYTVYARTEQGIGTLTITLKGKNDAPVAANDYNTAKESLLENGNAYTATDLLGAEAKGNVFFNDSDVDNGDTKSMATITGTGTVGSVATSGNPTYVFVTSSGWSSAKTGFYAYLLVSGNYYALKDASNNHITLLKEGTSFKFSAPATQVYNGTTYVALSGGIIIGNQVGFDATTANSVSGNIKYAVVSSIDPGSQTSSISGLTATSGVIAVGTGVPTDTKVLAVNYTNNIPTSLVLDKSVTSTAGTVLTFTAATGSTITGRYGTIVFQSTGAYVYTPFINNPDLNEGVTVTEIFDYEVIDTDGLKSPAKLYIDLRGSGTNDPNAIPQIVTAKEAGGIANATLGTDPTASLLTGTTTPTGTNVLSSVKTTQTQTFVPLTGTITYKGVSYSASIAGLYGTLYVKADGTYIYVVDNSLAKVEALNVGGTLKDEFQYEISNGTRIDWSTFTVTIDGANDTPVPAADVNTVVLGYRLVNGAYTKVAMYNSDGKLLVNDTDVDNADTKTVTNAGTTTAGTSVSGSTTAAIGTTIVGTYGSVKIGSDGSYVYTIDVTKTAVQNLNSTGTLTETFTYEVTDANGLKSTQTLTLTITALNQPPVNTNPASAEVKSDASTNAITVADLDVNLETVTLTVENGTLKYAGLTTPASSITITGTKAEIDAALASLVYTPNADFVGEDILTITSVDEENLSDITVVTIDVKPSALTVNDVIVNEGSDWTVFEVSGYAGQLVTLSVLQKENVLATDKFAELGTAPAIEIWNGSTWIAYTLGTQVAVPASGPLYVRVNIEAEQDAPFEGAETFELIAKNGANIAFDGLGTIKDDGTGKYWIDDAREPATAQELIDEGIKLDDERLKLFVDKNVTDVNTPVPGSVATNDVVPAGTTYGTPVADTDNPAGAKIEMNPDGTYEFVATLPGIYYYQVPVCGPGQTTDCELVTLQITVIDPTKKDNPAVINPDIAVTSVNTQVKINVLDNDKSGNTGGKLVLSTLKIDTNPANGTVTINADGTITYLPNHAFFGEDTFKYSICDDSNPAKCSVAEVFVTVIPGNVPDVTLAADDYALMEGSLDGKSSVSGNVILNDSNTDPAAKLSATLVTDPTTLPGTLVFNADGSYTFTPNADGTNPNDPCDYKAASQDLTKVSAAWKANDCDKDGLTNNEEATGVDDPSTPANPKGIKTNPLDPDSDGDGVSDGQEALDGTNPNDPCDYKAASQDLTKVSAAWKANDCDKDGIDDPATPANPKGIKTNPLDPDSDGDGVSDGQEALDGTNPNDPCDYKAASQDLTKVSAAWKSNDCDKDGLTNNEELTGVDDPATPANPKGVKTDPRNPDSDGDGVTDGKEALDGTNPNDPCDYKAASQDLTKVSAAWKSNDCDKDGLTNNEEVTGIDDPATPANPKGIKTDPRNPDSDGDGVTDGQEALDGTNPNDPCSFKPASQTLTPSAAWNNGDCDGDGVTNGKEKADGTNPLNGCDLKVASRTLPPTDAWKNGDCDGDGLTNEVDGIDDCDKDGTPNFLDPDTCDIDILLPNVFTPNGDGINDEIKPILLNRQEFVCFKVFNRWGNIIFETKDLEKGWDGSYREADQGTETFQWLAEGYDRNGKLVKRTGVLGLSYAVPLTGANQYLAVSIQGSYMNSRLDLSNATFPDQFDRNGPINGAVTIDPLGVGMPRNWFSSHLGASMFQTGEDQSWSLGVSVRDVTSPRIERGTGQEFTLAPTFGFQGSYEMQRGSTRYGLHGVANFKAEAYEQLLSTSISHQNKGSMLSMVKGGVAYRLRDAVIPYAELGFGTTSIGLYYELNISGINAAGYSRNAFELSLRKAFKGKK